MLYSNGFRLVPDVKVAEFRCKILVKSPHVTRGLLTPHLVVINNKGKRIEIQGKSNPNGILYYTIFGDEII